MAFRDADTPIRPPLIVVSPHLDDGVLSCGMLLAACPGTTVVTVFCGAPHRASTVTEWDRKAGFAAAAEAMAARCAEDRTAAGILQMRPVHLPFLDSQYGGNAGAETLRQTLRKMLGNEAAATVAIPLGLFHSDHRRVHRACLRLHGDFPERRWIFYEDVPYRCIAGEVPRQLARLRARGIALRPFCPAAAAGEGTSRWSMMKRRAVAAYRSQLRALGVAGCREAWLQERFWSIDSAKPAREADDDAA